MSHTPLVYAVTLNWKRPLDTIACLQTLEAQTYPRLHTIVVDNNSGDGSVEQIQVACPKTSVIANSENSGFARGMNTGIKQALAGGADFVFILNNDTLLSPTTIERLIRQYQSDIGILAPLIYYAEPSHIIWSGGNKINHWLLETKRGLRGQKDKPDWSELLVQDFVPACGLLVPRHVFEQIGYFDERFFMYYEDMDFCLRLRRAGFRVLVATRAQMWHKVSLSSGGQDTPNERYWMARSSVVYFGKHTRLWQLPFIAFWRTGSALRTSWRLWRAGKTTSLTAYWRGLYDGIRDTFPARKKET